MLLRCFVIFILLLSVFKIIYGAEDICSLDDEDIVEKCYERLFKRHVFVPYDMLPFSVQNYQGDDLVKLICKHKGKLDKCMSKTIVKRCFNKENLQQLSFPEQFVSGFSKDVPFYHQITVAYLHVDFLCGDMFQVVLDSVNCTNRPDLNACSCNISECGSFESTAQCYADAEYVACGEQSSLITKKTILFSLCQLQGNCKICDNLIKGALANIPDENSSSPRINSC